MAPDLSNISRSPRLSNAGLNPSSHQASPSLSRRTSAVMGPPPLPQNGSLPNSPRPSTTSDGTAFGGATEGPIRHPRPLTAAELHLELEKEQESIVNRLTRELSALRAQTASVASTASSTSDLFTTSSSDPYTGYSYQSSIVPTSTRRHRSSSNLSSRSARSLREALANSASVTSVSGVAAPRERERDHNPLSHSHSHSHSQSHSHQLSNRPSVEITRPEVSRQNSMSSSMAMHRTPSYTGTGTGGGSGGVSTNPRHSISSTYSSQAMDSARSPGTNAAVAAARYEEAERQRAELDAVKRENETLKMKIRELERTLSARREGTTGAGAGAGAGDGGQSNSLLSTAATTTSSTEAD